MTTAILLSGGKNTRIGENKALLKLGDKSVIEIMINKIKSFFDQIYIVTDDPEEYNFLSGVKLISDLIPEKKCTLEAVYSGLKQIDEEYAFVFANDMPYLNLNLIKYLWSLKENFDAIIPLANYNKITMHTIYSKNCLDPFEKSLKTKNKKISKVFRDLNLKYIPEEAIRTEDSDLMSFFHIKSYIDYMLVQKDF